MLQRKSPNLEHRMDALKHLNKLQRTGNDQLMWQQTPEKDHSLRKLNKTQLIICFKKGLN